VNLSELEAAIWNAMRRHGVTTATPVPFADEVLAAAAAYAAGDGDDVTLRRRQVLTRDGWHLAKRPS
jgi:hypothetical protein